MSDGTECLAKTQLASPSPADPTRTSEPSHLTPSAPPADVPSLAAELRNPERYQILGEHGRGGLGRVSRAHDRDLGRDVAIKELISRGPVSEVRFLREALITARLEHPGIVPVHEAGRWLDGTPFYAMKLVNGRPLRDLLAERTTADQRIALLHHVIAVADTIAYAHGKNIIHRDLKPANVIVGDFGETVVIDWGLAKDLTQPEESSAGGGPFRVSRNDDLTSAGTVLGTPAYMAPEQERGEPVDPRADVFAIGAMLWELCTLQKLPPGDRGQRQRILRRAGIDQDLVAIIDKAVAPDPARRYPDAGALAADLKAFKAGARIAARRYSLLAMLAHWTRRHRALALSVAAVIVLVLAGSALYMRNIATERDRADEALVRAESARNALAGANKATEAAYNVLSLKNAELLLASDPSGAWDVLSAYRGPDQRLANLLRAKALGSGISRLRVSAHKDSVIRLQPLPDGTLLSISEDGTIATTAAGSTSSILASNGANHDVNAFSAERELLAYACQPSGICLLDVLHHATDRVQARGPGAPGALALSPDGRRLAARYGNRIDLWDLGHSPATLLFSTTVPNARRIWVASDTQIIVAARNRVHLVDANRGVTGSAIDFAATTLTGGEDDVLLGDVTGKLLLVHPSHWQDRVWLPSVCDGPVNAVILQRRTHAFAYGCQDGNVGIGTTDGSHKLLYHHHQDSAVLSLASSADDRYFVFGGQRGAMHIYDSASGDSTTYHGQINRLCTVSGPTAAFPYFASGDDDGYIRIWDPPQTVSRTVIRGPLPFHDTTVLEDGTVVGVSQEPILRWWKSGATGSVAAHSGGAFALRRSPDRVHFVTFGFDDEIILWSSNPIAEVRRMKSGQPTNVVFLNDGQSVVSAGEDGRLLLWRPGDAAPQILARFSRPLASVEVLRRDETLIAAERGGSVWRIAARAPASPVQIRAGHGESISHLVASGNSQWIGVGTSEGEVVLYSTATWQPVPVMKAHGAIRVIVFSITMAMLSVVSEDGFVYLLPHPDAAGKDFLHWRSMALPVRNVRFSPDQRFLAITTSNSGVLFYSLRKRSWHYVSLPDVDVFRGRFSSDGTRFATVDGGGHVRLFDLTQFSD